MGSEMCIRDSSKTCRYTWIRDGSNSEHLIKVNITVDAPSDKLTLGCVNARSVRYALSMAIDELVLDQKLDMCSITETWLSSDQAADQVICGEITP